MPDFIGSIMVFTVIIVIFFSSWNSIVSDQIEFEEGDEMRVQGKQTLTFLITTSGYPEGWNSSNVEILGFAQPDHVLQEEKLEEFDNISYSRQKDLLQAPEYKLEIRNSSDIIQMNGESLEFGRDPADPETVVPFTRTVRVNDSGDLKTAEVNYIVWK